MECITVRKLTRVFKEKNKDSFQALDEINFNIKQGEIFGLLGPNGAGKTTTIKILSTMLLPTKGDVHIMGLDINKKAKEIRKHINFVFGGERSLYWRLSARDNLLYFCDIYKIPKKEQGLLVNNVLRKVGLFSVGNKRVESFSKGMKQRLQIGRALLNNPSIIFLDEPSIGLDPVGAMELKNLIKELAISGTTILLTTHYLTDAEELCDRIAIIDKGKIIANNSIQELEQSIPKMKRIEIINNRGTKQNIQNNLNKLSLEEIYMELLGESE